MTDSGKSHIFQLIAQNRQPPCIIRARPPLRPPVELAWLPSWYSVLLLIDPIPNRRSRVGMATPTCVSRGNEDPFRPAGATLLVQAAVRLQVLALAVAERVA